ncbi:hypothetical protein HMPREF9098_1973 [Kingella denitrificans ATCC 33394]|uniref:Uncharacterized protein n=1 Tax=Kingella denitrificans ATCC 33394 TaxID=888741 RepID=F0F1I8_9NEIS|nr:hypothetical protein HMPREF9098_1973 [Kingella denitrificans ATCC 33394]
MQAAFEGLKTRKAACTFVYPLFRKRFATKHAHRVAKCRACVVQNCLAGCLKMG